MTRHGRDIEAACGIALAGLFGLALLGALVAAVSGIADWLSALAASRMAEFLASVG